MGLLKNIEWNDQDKNTIVHRYDMKRDYVSKGSALTVRDSQVCIFAHKGKMADVFLPGFYKLDTDSIPILTTLMSWKYGFENVFRSDIYYVSTRQFTNNKWGTANPIIVRDKDFGPVRVRGFGSYAFRVKDAFVFMQELSGTGTSYETSDICDYLKSLLVTNISDAIGESGIPILDMAGNLLELSKFVKDRIQPTFNALGIELTQLSIENLTMPKEVEEALDKSATLGIMRGNLDAYTQMAQADALRDAAKNPGMAGSAMGAGMGFGMGSMFAGLYNNQSQPQQPATPQQKTVTCNKCGASVKEGAKFCAECGAPMGNTCPKCGAVVKPGAKFCAECGAKLTANCPSCGAAVKPGAKFCGECGEKL
ncbi:MAG: SPFH domain-containing protein [Clostridia bacterium]|nr:SPFH domain-containing protein [Clostridia bacterium]